MPTNGDDNISFSYPTGADVPSVADTPLQDWPTTSLSLRQCTKCHLSWSIALPCQILPPLTQQCVCCHQCHSPTLQIGEGRENGENDTWSWSVSDTLAQHSPSHFLSYFTPLFSFQSVGREGAEKMGNPC